MINHFFLLVELSFYGFAIYLILKRGELAIIYLPVLFFAYVMINKVAPALFFYTFISALIGKVILSNLDFFKYNIFALLIALLYLWLLQKTTDLVEIRPFVFSSMCLFILVPLAHSVFIKYSRPEIFNELYYASLMILSLFVINAIFSTISNYAPSQMYGISSGILYGNLYATDFNILPFAVFVAIYRLVSKQKPLEVLIFIVGFCFIMLSLRRSVMGLSTLALIAVIVILVSRNRLGQVFTFISAGVLLAAVIFFTTDFVQQFIHRYELRDLDDRALSEEKRFFEYDMLYTDTFVSFDYDPWLGYGLFDSGGNYGKGTLGPRTLHGDITNIVHSSGIIGLFLYLSMVLTAFIQSLKRTKSYTDFIIIAFCFLAFLIYTITGRYTQVESMLMMFYLMMLPLGRVKRTMLKVNPKPQTLLEHSL
ncbi:O-antigen ligase family protein [Echinicola jeungdonensis]|uniref:O-antigen ligase family protein n=1 Tax=Echinicola jeungdonensis TaxID=709343 RepID=A0ABV5J082_9BACT|nr:O-antigen ligase family protein [Echinicola jeungdonensis]MDN3671151.1 O-antigen ligase family protein [Echinicola jeungdonensis]